MRHMAALGVLFFTSLAVSATSSAQTVDASAELSDAISNLKAKHINSGKVDWDKLEARAQQMIAGKTQASDAYQAIYFIIVNLGEKHTSLLPANAAKAMQTGKKVGNSEPPVFSPPEGLILEGGIGLLKIPGFQGTVEQSVEYAQAARDALSKFSATRVCRIVVDLRGNIGGNMYPMVNGVESLLGSSPYGYWLSPDNSEAAWTGTNGKFRASASTKPLPPDRPNIPVAVLVDRATTSAGEDTVIAFEGRPNTKVFGQPTAGYVTANLSHMLPDGAILGISDAWITDRLHRPYKDRISPDQETAPGQETIDQAVAWLSQQHCDARQTNK